jgi:hypothetical protein
LPQPSSVGSVPIRNSIAARKQSAVRFTDFGFGIQADYGLANFDIRHAIHMSGSYELPVGAGKRFLAKRGKILDKVIGGWSMNWILTLQGGQPVTIPCTITTLSGAGCYALFVSGESPTAGKHDVNQFWNPAAFTNPEAATSVGQRDMSPLGGTPTQVAGPGFRQMDFSLRKDFKTSEKTRLEFHVEATPRSISCRLVPSSGPSARES